MNLGDMEICTNRKLMKPNWMIFEWELSMTRMMST